MRMLMLLVVLNSLGCSFMVLRHEKEPNYLFKDVRQGHGYYYAQEPIILEVEGPLSHIYRLTHHTAPEDTIDVFDVNKHHYKAFSDIQLRYKAEGRIDSMLCPVLIRFQRERVNGGVHLK